MATKLLSLRLNRCDLVDRPANPKAHVVLYKRDAAKSDPAPSSVHVDTPEWLTAEKARFGPGDRTSLPDSAFAAVWTDAGGNKQRKLPYRHADGSVDLPHLRNALSRLSQTDMPASVRATAQRKLESAKENHMTDKGKMASLLSKLAGIFKEADPDMLRELTEKQGESGDPISAMKSFTQKFSDAMKAYGEEEMPPEHPVHALKALFKEMGDFVAACDQTGSVGKRADEPITKREIELQKALDEAKAANVAAVEKAAIEKAAVEKKLADERDVRDLENEKVELRKFAAVSVNVDTDAKLFKSLKSASPDTYGRVMELLKGADAAVASNNTLNRELGSGNAGDGKGDPAWAAIEAKANEMVAKGDKTMTIAKALTLAMAQNPELVKQHYAATKPQEQK